MVAATNRNAMFMRRLVWMGTGYIAGAASSWWVRRKVRRTVKRVLPEAIRKEATARLNEKANSVGRTVGTTVERARAAADRVRPMAIDLRDRDRAIS